MTFWTNNWFEKTFLRKHARSRSHTEIATELHHQQVSSCAHSIALEDLLVDWCHCGLSWSACWRSSCSFSWIILVCKHLDLIYMIFTSFLILSKVIRKGSGLVRWSLEHISKWVQVSNFCMNHGTKLHETTLPAAYHHFHALTLDSLPVLGAFDPFDWLFLHCQCHAFGCFLVIATMPAPSEDSLHVSLR